MMLNYPAALPLPPSLSRLCDRKGIVHIKTIFEITLNIGQPSYPWLHRRKKNINMTMKKKKKQKNKKKDCIGWYD